MIKTYPIDYPNGPSWLQKIKQPLLFQGWGKKSNYFEGWYYKVVDATQNIAYAVIPGVSLNDEDPHAFIQVIDGARQRSSYHRFDLSSFECNPKKHYVRVGESIFSEHLLQVQLPDLTCSLTATQWSTLPYQWHRPGIMGWYAYIPTMQCNHGLGSMDHRWSGDLRLHNQTYSLKDADGYVEKDWGSSFPKSWIWTQCNTFEHPSPLCIFASVAHIPWRGNHFIGFLGAIYIDGQIEIFSTYTNAKRTTTIDDHQVTILYRKRNKFLKISATKAPGAELISPISGAMRGKVNESLLATVDIEYHDGVSTTIAKGSYAGLEIAGDYNELLT